MAAELSAYLAGPDVFAPDAGARFAAMRDLCQARGVIPVCPVDGAPPAGLSGTALARYIKIANIGHIRATTCVIANISPFRGPNMDPGTAYEIGYAEALGRPVFLWSESAATLAERTPAGDTGVDARGWMIENFGLAENLMIGITDHGPVAPSFAAALAGMLHHFGRSG
jgi:nucleoside 2-deoxyribosyltransferase